MTTVITRMFDTYDEATRAVRELESTGIAHSDISIVANNADNRVTTTTGTDTLSATDPNAPADGAGTGASVGTLVGGGAGLLAGLGMLAIPGIGPVVAAGWLVATLTGAGVGAAAGGLLGSLVGAGVPEEHAHVYAEGVRRGGTLVTVRAPDGMGGQVESVLGKYSVVDPSTRGAQYRETGWSNFDEGAAPIATTGATMGSMGTTTGTSADTLTGTRTPII